MGHKLSILELAASNDYRSFGIQVTAKYLAGRSVYIPKFVTNPWIIIHYSHRHISKQTNMSDRVSLSTYPRSLSLSLSLAFRLFFLWFAQSDGIFSVWRNKSALLRYLPWRVRFSFFFSHIWNTHYEYDWRCDQDQWFLHLFIVVIGFILFVHFRATISKGRMPPMYYNTTRSD